MSSNLKKNLLKVAALGLVVAFFSSCNRGGYGCPYEMEAAVNVLSLLK